MMNMEETTSMGAMASSVTVATIMPEEVPRKILAEQRLALFGSAMQGGGLYKELMDMVDELLFLSLGKAGGCDGSA